MKKSTLVVLIGGFIVLTGLLGPVSQEKIYRKQKNFSSPEEIIQILDTKPILGIKDGTIGEVKETEDFSECLSVRKRLTNSDMNIAKLNVKEVVELDENSENALLNYYNVLRQKFTKRLPVSREKAVRLKINSYYISNWRTGEMEANQTDGSDEIIDLILIDEGEGYVIDFVNLFNSDYAPDYSKIDEYGNFYYEGKDYESQNMSDDSSNDENVAGNEKESNSGEEVEANA